jgi:hypothetical protein
LGACIDTTAAGDCGSRARRSKHTSGKAKPGDLRARIAAPPSFTGSGFLLPSRNSELFRWCLDHGLRMTKAMVLMSIGLSRRLPAVGGLLTSDELSAFAPRKDE